MRATSRLLGALVLGVASSVGCASHDDLPNAPPPASAGDLSLASRGVEVRPSRDGLAATFTIDGMRFGVRASVGAIPASALSETAVGVRQEVPLGRGAAEAPGSARLSLDLEAGARLVQPRGYGNVVEIVDARGVARARVRVDGDALRLRVDRSTITIAWTGEGAAPPPIALTDWTATSVPLAIRDHHTATLLPTGDVLLAGGYIASHPTKTTEIYDATSGRFRAGVSLGSARAEHSATMRDDGRVMIVGGVSSAGNLATTEFYDALADTFTPGPALGVARAGHAATRLADGRTLVVGGDGSTSAEVLDPTGTVFTAVGSTSTPSAGAAALLADGRVAVVGSPLQLFDPTTDTFTDGGALMPGNGATITRLQIGPTVISGLCPAVGCIAGGAVPPGEFATLWPDGSFTTTTSEHVRNGAAASLLPSGEVLFTGGAVDAIAYPPTSDASAFDIFLLAPNPVHNMAAVRAFHTSTLLPSGSTLIVGGAASVDLFLPREVGDLPTAVGGGSLQTARADFAAVTLLDGSPLVSGGRTQGQCLTSTERIQTSDVLDAMAHPRTLHTMTLLDDGRVFAVGGECDGAKSSEIYEPVANVWSLSGTPNHARRGHTATLLFDGRVLVAGGFEAGSPTTSTEIYSPATGAFVEGPYDFAVGGAHAASILPSGRVLLVGENRAAIFDPATDQFALSTEIGAAYGEPTATLLPSGKVLIAGRKSQNGLVYDDANESFTFTGPVVKPLDHHEAILTPSGRVALIGGLTPPIEVTGDSAVQLFDPLAEGGIGGFIAARPLYGGGRGNHRVVLSLGGDVLVVGGEVCQSAGCPQQQLGTFETWGEPSNFASGPDLASLPATATPGTDVVVVGQSFRGLAASSGTARASDGGYPIAIWQSVLYGGRALGAFFDVSDTGATWRVPSTPFRGPGVLRVSTNATLSYARPITIGTASDGHTCSGPHECTSGHCADGFCCDDACEGSCRSCSGEVSGTGVNGVCSDIAPGQDPFDACVIGKGAECAFDSECSTGFCVDGVCCESRCDRQCEACDVDHNLGECTPVSGAPHGDRASCPTSADACDNGVCDGVTRDSCTGVVGPCAPYACGESACETSCDPSLGPEGGGCALDFRCTKEAICVPRLASCDGNLSTSRDGEITDCSPYNCQADGSCREACGSVLDCADPFVCDPSGRCVARGADTVDESCAVGSLATGGGGVPGEPIAALALALLFVRRVRARTGGRSPVR